MAKARAIVKRRKAVRNIRKITQTMQLIATARYQKCLQRAVASQPYTRKITEMIQTLGGQQAGDHPLLRPSSNETHALVLVITSNRGLCGAYNAAVLRCLMEHRRALQARGQQADLEVVGKKGINYLRFLRIPFGPTITNMEDSIAFARVAEMAERYMQAYQSGAVARVDVVYTHFVSVSTQRPQVAQLLPIEPPEVPAGGVPASRVEFEFSPAPGELLRKLIPEAVRLRLFQCFNDSIVSEQVARMVAMKAATDAAGDMTRFLTQQYNRARQSQITMELADIVGGANAVR
ncbi:MAG: ATP synthase F1 subunit gamma [Phycisphaerales bacterium]|nr:ATP synthase F1 subunit gamma [Phycisphaerales bacterium]